MIQPMMARKRRAPYQLVLTSGAAVPGQCSTGSAPGATGCWRW
jgi:hypothetical protein